MGTITRTYTFTDGTTADADEVNAELDNIIDEINGNLDNDNIASDAAIAGSKLSGVVLTTTAQTIAGEKDFQDNIKSDVISESTSATGVTIDGLVVKDSGITVGRIIQTVTSYSPDASGTATLTVNLGNIHKITMPAGNITIAISGETTGQCFIIEIIQDDVGSRTVTWFDTIKWADGSAPTLTTTASKKDTFGFRVTGTDAYDAYVIGQNI